MSRDQAPAPARAPMRVPGCAALLLCAALYACGGGSASPPGPAPAPITIGGSASGFTGTLVLANGADTLSLTRPGSFSFPTALASGTTYAVSVIVQPPAQYCTVANGSGTATAQLRDVSVTCAPGTPNSLHDFGTGGNDGANPNNGLIDGGDGYFYGTAQRAGGSGKGTLYRITPAGSLSVLYAFSGGNDGGLPNAPPTLGADGRLYGTTFQGGSYGSGTVYRIDVDGANETTLHSFNFSTEGANPQSPLNQASDGNFYTVLGSGPNRLGSLVRITPGGSVTMLHAFGSAPGDLQSPEGALVQIGDTLYGTGIGGGAGGAGGLFSYNIATHVYAVVASFDNTDGAAPHAGLMLAADGKLYGTAMGAGANGQGAVFRFDPVTNALQAVYSFSGSTDGSSPLSIPFQGSDGMLYVTTNSGGPRSGGTLVRVATDGSAPRVMYAFDSTAGSTGIYGPTGPLLQTVANGYLYGTTYGGGSAGLGAVYVIE